MSDFEFGENRRNTEVLISP